MRLLLTCLFLTSSLAFAEPMKCNCINCECTPESHCGCLSQEGCGCTSQNCRCCDSCMRGEKCQCDKGCACEGCK